MKTITTRTGPARRQACARRPELRGACAATGVAVVLATCVAFATDPAHTSAREQPKPSAREAPQPFPSVHPGHKHVRALLENALRYVAPATG